LIVIKKNLNYKRLLRNKSQSQQKESKEEKPLLLPQHKKKEVRPKRKLLTSISTNGPNLETKRT
jgi:hypothetical protein